MLAVDARVLEWVRGAVAPGARVRSVRALGRRTASGPWRIDFDVHEPPTAAVLHLTGLDRTAARRGYATQAAALELAGRHRLDAPRLLACDLDGACTGRVALLTTLLSGTSRIPCDTDARRLRRLGAAAAAIHAVPARASPVLPTRAGPLADAAFDDAPATDRSAELLAAARTLLDSPPPDIRSGLVHGDLWQGNTLWERGRYIGAIDWDYAGVGPAGVDLGSLRCDAAVLHGLEAADEVLLGWEQAHGGPASDVAWWDVAAAASTPPDLREWVSAFSEQGREDLDAATATTRRDDFLQQALRPLT